MSANRAPMPSTRNPGDDPEWCRFRSWTGPELEKRRATCARLIALVDSGLGGTDDADPFHDAPEHRTRPSTRPPEPGAGRPVVRGEPCERCRSPVPSDSKSRRFCQACLRARRRDQNRQQRAAHVRAGTHDTGGRVRLDRGEARGRNRT